MKFKLTASQRNFYNKNFTLDSQIWNQGVMEIFPEVYSYEQLNNAYNKLVETHESLRVKLVETENGIVADVRDHEYINYRFWQVETEDELMKKAQDFLNEPTDRYGLLVDCAVFQTPTTSGIMINAHHIVVDGFSAFVMSEHINGFLKDENFAPVIQKYADYVAKEEKYKQSRRYSKSQEFWLKEFSGKPQCNIFPTAENMLDFSSSEINRVISADIFGKIRTLCEKYEITPASFFNAVNAAYLYKQYEAKSFTIGVPVFNRTTADELNTIGLYMHLVPLVINITEASFIENAKRIEDSKMNLFRHQSFTQQDIKALLTENKISVNQLFDVVSDYQEFSHNEEYEMRIPYGNNLSVPIEMHLQTFDGINHNLKIRYRTAYFNEKDIRIMLDSIFAIAEDAAGNPEKIIYDLEMLSDEHKQLLCSFNDTAIEYESKKCVHELFEEQSEKVPEKTAITGCYKKLTYKELNEESNRIAHSLIEKGIGKDDIVAFRLSRKVALVASMLGIFKTGAAYLPIDPDYPEDRIGYMLTDSGAKYCITDENVSELLKNENTENPKIAIDNSDICYCIYTSGSTGKPKGTLLTHRNVVNYVSRNEKNVHFGITKNCTSILSVTTAGFDIFVTETLLPLANGMEIVLANEEQARIQSKLIDLLSSSPADIIQTTPTKMKSLMTDKTQLDYLKKFKAIILGGEALDTSLVTELKNVTDAEIYNIYGPTEATVWVTYAKIEDSQDITIGKPMANTQIHIVDKYMKLVPVGVTGELCIAGDCVANGYLNREELTQEKFIDNPFGDGKIYRTGDLAYRKADGNIVFIGRNDFQVKIRGQRIELGEIENAIAEVDGIVHSVVVVRKDKTDRQLICAFYTGTEKAAKEIKAEISEKLPKYMIPHVFTHLDEIPLTSSGKINRNALPGIDLENISTETEYIAPETEKEILLTECIRSVLDTEKISILDNFFDIGGDSLKAIELTAKLEEKGYTVPVKTIFSCKDIRELAEKLDEKEAENINIEYGNIIPATPAQMRVYTAQFMSPETPLYNIPNVFRVEELDAEKLETALNKLIERHEALKTRFENKAGQIVQIIEEKAEIKLQKLENDNTQEFIKAFDLTKAPLLRAGYYKNTVMIDIHHIIADGETMPIFFRELNELYMGRNIKKAPVQYGEFAVQETDIEESEKYWLDIFSDEIPELELPSDYPRNQAQSFTGTILYDRIDKKLHDKITDKCKELNITPYVFYMTCYNILLSKYSGNEDIVVGMPISGRSSKYLESVGMFVNTVALRSKPEGSKTISQFMQEVKENSISAIDNQNYPFNNLVKKLNIQTNGRNPLYDVMMAYQSYEMTDIDFGDKKAELLPISTTTSKCDINFNVMPRENDVVLAVEYCTDLYKEETVQKFINSFKLILEQCLEENTLIKDITAMSEDEKQTVLYDFNDTAHMYDVPEESTVYTLFEDTASRMKSKTCVTANGKSITFGELLALSEALDSSIRNVTKGKKSIIAVIAERSVEMYAGIYGIIRGGNAYMPIAPDYPQERIEYMLKNSNAALVVAQNKFTHLAGDVACIDMTDFINNTPETDILPCAAEADDTAYVIYTSGSTGKPKGAKVSHRSAVNRILWMHEAYPLGAEDVILQKTPYTFDVSVWELFWWGMVGGSLVASKPDEHFLPAKILDEVYMHGVTHLHFVPSVFELFVTYLEKHPEECYKFASAKYVFLSGEALSASLVTRFYAMFDSEKVGLHNLYGPTECAVDVTYYDCTPDDVDPVPIGKPIYNTAIYITDKYMNCVPQGVTGELCIGGVNVGQGYLNNPELTAEKFLTNPFGDGRIYRTGDNAYIREDGEIIFCGRMDNQIKLNGQRIEIGEIESVIGNIDGIESVAVILRKNNGRDILAAFWCGKDTDEKTIRDICEKELPSYMVPGAFCQLDKLPLNPSGKLDRKALSAIEIIESNTDEYEAPENDTESYIAEVFGRILSVGMIGRNSDFFELGGTSLSMIALLSEDKFKDISAADFIANPTPSKLARLMNEEKISEFSYIRMLKDIENSKKALVFIPYAGGGAEAFAALSKSLSDRTAEYSLYFFDYPRSYAECENVAKELYEIAKVRKLYVYSHCAGSAAAMQVINILEEMQNGIVEHYVAGASIPPEKPEKDNFWNTVSDEMLVNVLIKAGAPFGSFSDEQISDMVMNFRKDTDFMTECFYKERNKVPCPVSVVISKDDLFTENFTDAGRLWSLYAENVCGVHFIDTKTHYFQSDNSNELAEIILSVISK
ncbi:MAG: amino acid adenylation domain-containing protein [Clostridia bacterium]|nr:amino acid adenylation domain-containing protein [Clostridia bacterium]